jgi:hypothetical protein
MKTVRELGVYRDIMQLCGELGESEGGVWVWVGGGGGGVWVGGGRGVYASFTTHSSTPVSSLLKPRPPPPTLLSLSLYF